MYEICTDEEVFQKFWKNDAETSSAHFQAGTQAWHTTWEDFLDFCLQCERVYHIEKVALLYVEKIGDTANLHLSVIKGQKVDINELYTIRDELLRDYEMLYAWSGSKNRGLKKILESCGLRFYGFEMIKGWHRGKPMVWQCYSLNKSIGNKAISC